MKEKWKIVHEFPSYKISSEGRLLTPKKKIIGEKSSGWYIRFRLRENGVLKHIPAHRLVATAFIGPIPGGMVVNHKDGIKDNNKVSNLEIITPAENIQHAHKTGLIRPAYLPWGGRTQKAIREIVAGFVPSLPRKPRPYRGRNYKMIMELLAL